MNPSTGRMVKEDGTVINIADLIGGTETGKNADIESYSPKSGRMVKEDGTVINITEGIEKTLNKIKETEKDLGNLSFSVNDTDGGLDITYKK